MLRFSLTLLSLFFVWFPSGVVQAATESYWLTPTDGADWMDAANWSTQPIVPANGSPLPNSGYHAIFETGSTEPYTVRLEASSIALDQLTIRDAATINQSGGAATLGNLQLQAGRYLLTNAASLSQTSIDALGGVVEIEHGSILDSDISGRVELTGASPQFGRLSNVTLVDAHVSGSGNMTLDGQINGRGTLRAQGELSVLGPAELGPEVTLEVPPDNGSSTIRAELLLRGSTEVYGNLFGWSRTRNLGHVRVYPGGSFTMLRLSAPDVPEPNAWTVHSGGYIGASGNFDFDPLSTVTLQLDGAVNWPLIDAARLNLAGTLVLRVGPEFLPRADQTLRVISASILQSGEFSEVRLGPLPVGFAWDTSRLLSEGTITFTGPPTRPIAHTRFLEPPDGALSFAAPPGSRELGFQTSYELNNGASPEAGVNALLGQRVLTFQSLDTSTIFDTVSIAEFANTAVDLEFSLSQTGYEFDDFVELVISTSDGLHQPISVFSSLSTYSQSPTDIARLSLHVPSSWPDVTVEVLTHTDSSSGAERINLHSLDIVGYKYAQRMELPGDYTVDGQLGVDDLRKFDAILARELDLPEFDLDGSGTLDADDRIYWIETLWGSYVGDSNLDGMFGSSDLVTVFQAGEYEDDVASNSRWETGDWNGDREFSSSDLVLAFQRGGYEQGGRGSVHAVPEPAATSLAIAAVTFGLNGTSWRRRSCRWQR